MHADRTQIKRPTSLWRIQPEEPCDQPGHVRHPAWAEIIVYAESTHAAHLVAMQLDAAIQAFSIGNGSPTTRTAIPIRSSYAVEPVEPNATIESCASAFPEIVAATLRKQPPTQNDTPLFTDVVITRETRVSCNGADPQLGHPKVWYAFREGKPGSLACDYCSRVFIYIPSASSGIELPTRRHDSERTFKPRSRLPPRMPMKLSMTDIPAKLPDDAGAYGRSPDFTTDNLPDKLRSAHSTKAGTWGLLHVLEGRVRYELEPPKNGVREATAPETVVIEPEVLHHVEFLEPGRFFIEFYRRAGR